MRTLLVLTVLTASAAAQERIELKGYWIGMPLAEFRQIHTGKVWVKDKGKHEVDLPLCSDQYRNIGGRRKPGEVDCETSTGEQGIASVTFGGRRAFTAVYTFAEGKLSRVRITFQPPEYQTVLEAFTAKFGQPTSTKEAYQNGFGAKWEGSVATWSKGGAVLIFREGPGNGPGQRFGEMSEVLLLPESAVSEQKPPVDF